MDGSVWSGGPASPSVRPRFVGTARDMAPTVVRGLLLTLVTLGIYRFWYVTNVRRFIWGASEVDGDGVEYTGRGVELFFGFLIALAVVVPLNALVYFVGLLAGPAAQAAIQPLFSTAILILAQFALYRARRYRLNRTIWRGIRFQQGGSGVTYAMMSFGWGIAVFFTFGFCLPFARASLEQYKMSNTWYGDQQGAFAGTGWGLMKRGWFLWVLGWIMVIGPIALIAVVAAKLGSDGLRQHPGVIAGLGASVLSALLLIPIYQAIEFRWWANGCSVGPAIVRSDLGAFAFLKAYLIYLVVALITGGIFVFLGYTIGKSAFAAGAGQLPSFALTIAAAGGYFVWAVTLAALWQLFGARLIWKRSLEGVSIFNLAALSAAQSSAPPANAFGEGIADAIDFAGF